MNWQKRIFYLCGQLGLMMLVRFFFQWIIAFTSVSARSGRSSQRIVLFSGAAVGTVLLLFRIFDGITDPLAGVLSDSWVRKGEKRKTLLLLAAGMPALGLLLCFSPTAAMNQDLRWLLLIAGFFLFFVGYTIYAIPYWSLLEDYSQGQPSERSRLSNLLGIGLLLATGIGFVVTPLLVEKLGYFQAAIVILVPGTLLMTLPFFADPGVSGKSLTSAVDDLPALSFGAGFKIALQHRRFISFLLLFSGAQMALTIMTAASPIIAIELLGGSEGDVAKLMGPFLGAALLSFAAVPRLAATWGWEKVVRGAALLLTIAFGVTSLLGSQLIGNSLPMAMLLFACGGPMIAIMLGLEGEAIASCAAESDRNLVGVYFGVSNFIIKTLNGVAIFLVGILTEMSRSGLGGESAGSLAGGDGARLMIMSASLCVFLGLLASLCLQPPVEPPVQPPVQPPVRQA